jgi:hypothetical protein
MHLRSSMLIDIGHSHPDFTYPNDQKQVQMTLGLTALAAFVIVAMILATLL